MSSLASLSQLLCHIAKIMNFGQFSKKNQYFYGVEGTKNKKFTIFFTKSDKYGQIRTNTDEPNFLCRIFAPSELNDAAALFPY